MKKNTMSLAVALLAASSCLAEADTVQEASGAAAREETLALMTFDFGSACGIYATGDSKARIVKGGSHPGSRGMLEIHNRTEKWNSGEFNLTGRVEDRGRYRFAANVRQDSAGSGTFQLSLKIVDGSGTHYELVAKKEAKKGEWTHIEGEYRLGEGVKNLYPYIELYSSTDAFFVDDVSFVALDAPVRDLSLEKDLAPLKDAFRAAGITCGASVGDAVLGDPTGLQRELLVRHFDSLSPENQLKAQFVLDHGTSVANLERHQRDAALDFGPAKTWFDFAKAHGMRVSAQALVWFMLTPEWFFHDDYDTAKPLASRELMLARMENYIRRVLGWCEAEYPGLVRSWVVVNEGVDGDAKPHVRDDLFFKTIGEDYIARAFEFAGKYRPKTDCIFLYNDYNMEYYAEKTDFVLDYLKKHGLVSRGLVDGIGFQCHVKMDWPGVSEIRKNCAKVAKARLAAEVTEMDVQFGRSQVAKFPSEREAFERQGARFEKILRAFLDARCDGLDLRNVTWWGLTDAYTWLTDFHGEQNFPLLFDRDNKAKPAFFGVLKAVGAAAADAPAAPARARDVR